MHDRMRGIKEVEGGYLLAVRVITRSHKVEIVGWKEDELWIRLTKPPVDGQANHELVNILSTWLNVSKSCITLVSGDKSLHKKIKIETSEKTSKVLLRRDKKVNEV